MDFALKSISISCTDLKRSREFYVNVLGAKPKEFEMGACPQYMMGNLSISLMENADRKSGNSFPTHAMPILSLEVGDIPRAHAHLKNQGCEVFEDSSDDNFLLICDPDGLVIEIWNRK